MLEYALWWSDLFLITYCIRIILLLNLCKLVFHCPVISSCYNAYRCSRKATPYGIWLLILMDLGAIFSLATVAAIVLLSQTRIFYAMAKDGLLPSIFARINSNTITPWLSTIFSGTACLSTLQIHWFPLVNRCVLRGDRWFLSGRYSRRDSVDQCTGHLHLCPRGCDRGTSYLFCKTSFTVVLFAPDALYSPWYTATFSRAFRPVGDSSSGHLDLPVPFEGDIERIGVSLPRLVNHWANYLFLLWLPAFKSATIAAN